MTAQVEVKSFTVDELIEALMEYRENGACRGTDAVLIMLEGRDSQIFSLPSENGAQTGWVSTEPNEKDGTTTTVRLGPGWEDYNTLLLLASEWPNSYDPEADD